MGSSGPTSSIASTCRSVAEEQRVRFPIFSIGYPNPLQLNNKRNARRPVSRVLSALAGRATIPLESPSPATSRGQPGWRGGKAPGGAPLRAPSGHPYSALLPVGFAVPPPLPGARWALTPPFHPYPRGGKANLSTRRGGLFSVALSLGSPPPAVSRHRIPVEPGLSSTASREAGSGRPAVWRGGVCDSVGWGSSHPAVPPAPLPQPASARAATASSRARVPASARPPHSSCRQCRWKATSATSGRAGSTL